MTRTKTILLCTLLVASSTCVAAERKIGDWSLLVTDNKNGVFAYTTTETGAMFGLMCRAAQNGCLWTLRTGNPCEENTESHYLLNSDIGVISVESICQKTDEGSNYMHIGPFSDVEYIVKGAKALGIAMPLADGKFRVIRFSLIGSNQSVDAAYEIHEALRKSIDDEVI